MRTILVVLLCCVFLLPVLAEAQTPPNANSDTVYQSLRKVRVGGEAVGAENLVLKRDAGVFTFTSGTFCFLSPVEGKVTGAVFNGSGKFEMTPPLAVERRNLSRLTNQGKVVEEFDQLVLRFTDGTYDELKKAGSANAAQASNCNLGQLDDINNALRKQLKQNLTARILQDVDSKEPGGLFVAVIKGKKYSGKMIYTIDPHGVMSNEEVSLLTWDDNKYGVWASFHLASEYASGKASSAERNSVIKIENQKLDATFDKGAKLNGQAVTTFVARANGVRVVPFDLFPTLRVQSVKDENGQELKFIQESKDEDSDFWVILAQPLAAGQKTSITTVYAGKDAVSNEGGGNYYPIARSNWFPNSANASFDDYATFDMRLTVPKGLKMVASGTLVNEVTEGSQTISRWRSEGPQTVAGFHFGDFKKETKEVHGLVLETYANAQIPDSVRGLQATIAHREAQGERLAVALGTMSTVDMAKRAMAEAELATQLYTDYFGPMPYKRLAMTQQVAMNYGQSWPGLVWLPISYFYDAGVRFQLMGFDSRGYFDVVGPHEIAHQWWGHSVTWASYRDQWMSEGFSDTSASIFTQAYRKTQDFHKFWSDERDLIIERNKDGFRPIDVGPVTLGYRLNNSKVGNVTTRLIYPKGAYILHMIRMMMWTPKNGDEPFKAMMKDFVNTYRNKPATTEDFKAIVEKHMTPDMDATGDRKMDWFFDEYVYGTALPKYALDYRMEGGTLVMKVSQSGVDDNFRMIVPVYVEFNSGKTGRLGSMLLTGNSSREVKVPMQEAPKRVLLNYHYDVLCDK